MPANQDPRQEESIKDQLLPPEPDLEDYGRRAGEEEDADQT